MFTAITIAAVGPYREPTTILLDPKGRTDIVQPSASGKSTLLLALSWCLWGGKSLSDVWIHDGQDEAVVTLTTAKGAKLARGKRRGQSPWRQIDDNAKVTEPEWLSKLGPLGRDPDLLRVIVCPLAWCELAEGPGGGRPFRDLLATLLPSANLRDVVAELCPDLRPSDSISEKEAENERRDWNRRRDELSGSVKTLEGQQLPADARVDQPAPADVQRAKATIEAAKAWTAWGPVAAWDARLAELGARPDVDGDKVATRREAVAKARAKVDELAASVSALGQPLALEGPTATLRELNEATNEVRKLEAAGGKCAGCDRPWPDALTALNVARSRAETAQRQHDIASKDFDKSRKKAAEKRSAELETEKGNLAAAKLSHQRAQTSLEAALRDDPVGAWDAAHRALGRRPAGPAVAPEADEPTAEHVQQAGDTLRALEQAAGARREAEATRKRLAEGLAKARSELAEATAQADHFGRLVDAVRRAPSIVAERQLGHLGTVTDGRAVIQTCDPNTTVSIRLPAEGPAVEVQIDGRPYHTASRGKTVVADLALRQAMRRARKLGWLPIFVDNAQDWSGELVTEGPAIVLRTAAVALREAA